MKYKCPVCLTDSLNDSNKHYSYEVCRMCGVEFGYDDAINESGWTVNDWDEKADEVLAARHKKLRKIWQDAGRLNWWEETQKANFTSGVFWFDEYWKKHPDEYVEWQENVVSRFYADR